MLNVVILWLGIALAVAPIAYLFWLAARSDKEKGKAKLAGSIAVSTIGIIAAGLLIPRMGDGTVKGQVATELVGAAYAIAPVAYILLLACVAYLVFFFFRRGKSKEKKQQAVDSEKE